MLRAEDALHDGQQRSVLVPGGGRIPRLPGVVGELVAGGQGVRVLGTVGVILLVSIDDQLEQVPGRPTATAVAEVLRDPPHAVADQVEHGPAVRQQHREHRPDRGEFGVGGDRGRDQHRGRLLPLGGHIRRHLGEGDVLD